MDDKKKLKDLLSGVEVVSTGNNLAVEVFGIATDSKSVRDGYLFVAIKGYSRDGHDFINEAVLKGAKAIVAQDGCLPAGDISGAPVILVSDSRKASADISNNFYNRPSDKARVIGITGTNGKTTVSYLCESIFKKAGFKTGVVGTINYRYGQRLIPAVNTTPGALELAQIMGYMVDNGAKYIVMEVSSHSLSQGRVRGVDFKTAVFTNITPEHLDYHKTMQEYKNAKAILFKNLAVHAKAVLNIDDVFGKELSAELCCNKSALLTYSLGSNADIYPEKYFLSSSGVEAVIVTPAGKININSRLVGKFNLYNILAAASVGIAESVAIDKIAAGIDDIMVVPGRLEKISCGQKFDVYVDYAHTDDALKNVLGALRELSPAKIITLFGCGGDRDKTKRPRMGKIAASLSDYVIITTDNPRSEDPESIAGQVLEGVLKNDRNKALVIIDRQEAIKKAISLARSGDVVLLAGKGHETYQVFKNTTQPFDDSQIAKNILNAG